MARPSPSFACKGGPKRDACREVYARRVMAILRPDSGYRDRNISSIKVLYIDPELSYELKSGEVGGPQGIG